MDYEEIGKVLTSAVNLLNLGDENVEKATLIITQVISLTQVASIAYKGFKELQELAGVENMSQAELQKRFAENDKRMAQAIARLDKIK